MFPPIARHSFFSYNFAMLTAKSKLERTLEVMAHVLTWSYIFLSPLLFKRNNEPIDWPRFSHDTFFPLATCIAFYVNYFLLIPRFVLRESKWTRFLVTNFIMFAIFQSVLEIQAATILPAPPEPPKDFGAPHDIKHMFGFPPPKFIFILRGFLTYVFVMGISVTLRLSMKWKQSEKALAEAELGRSQAELKNLKNQINPHFLLNTLNNIYALTAFDQAKAQNAIMELSRLLRYMLYENQTDRVSLNKEIEFLESYIELMKLRIYNKVEVQADFDVPENEDIPVAPLIFISLVENAFKHGVSSTERSYIRISLKADRHFLRFVCENSNFPKNQTDKSPGGIGLRQVANRLELSYPGRYRWTSGVTDDGKEFHSEIIISDTPLQI